MPLGASPGDPNITTQELQELIRENDALWTVDDDPASAGYDAILAARPTDPAALAVLVRWLVRKNREHSCSLTGDGRDQDLIEHVAARLEAMARVEPGVGTVTLSAETAVQVRATMLEVLALHGQHLVEECEPGLDSNTREIARAMRSAIKLLDGATGSDWQAHRAAQPQGNDTHTLNQQGKGI